MGNKNENLIGHIKNAFIYTFAGLKAAWENELAFRGEVVVVMIMSPLGLWLGRSAVERALLIASLLLILLAELVNSALEAVVAERLAGGKGRGAREALAAIRNRLGL